MPSFKVHKTKLIGPNNYKSFPLLLLFLLLRLEIFRFFVLFVQDVDGGIDGEHQEEVHRLRRERAGDLDGPFAPVVDYEGGRGGDTQGN
jgi:hypothetical protein